MKKIILLACLIKITIPLNVLAISDEFLEEVRQRISDVKNGIKDKKILNERTSTHCESPLFLLTRQDLWLEELCKTGKDQIYFGLIVDLLNAGADPNAENHDTDTILGNAVKYSNTDVVKLLLLKGANPNVQPSRKLHGTADPLLISLIKNLDEQTMNGLDYIDKIKLMIANKANLGLKENGGFSFDGKKIGGRNIIEVLKDKIAVCKTSSGKELFLTIQRLIELNQFLFI